MGPTGEGEKSRGLGKSVRAGGILGSAPFKEFPKKANGGLKGKRGTRETAGWKSGFHGEHKHRRENGGPNMGEKKGGNSRENPCVPWRSKGGARQ